MSHRTGKPKRTHCYNGHPYSGDNLRLERITNKDTGAVYTVRRCKRCQLINTKRWMRANGRTRMDYARTN